MLADSRVSAVLPVVNLERARKFYEEKLGLRTGDAPGGVMFQCGHGSQLVLYQRDSPTKADHTAAGWEVDDVEKVLAVGYFVAQLDEAASDRSGYRGANLSVS